MFSAGARVFFPEPEFFFAGAGAGGEKPGVCTALKNYDDLLHCCKNCIQKNTVSFYIHNVYTTKHARKTETFVIQINCNM